MCAEAKVTRRYRKRNAKTVVAAPVVAAPPEPSLLDKLRAQTFVIGKVKPCKYAGIVDGCLGVFTLGFGQGNKETCDNLTCKNRLRTDTNNPASTKYRKNNKAEIKTRMNGPTGHNRRFYLSRHPDAKPTFGDRRQTVKTRAKISATTKGRKHTAEHSANISAALKGRKQTVKTRAKISAAKKGRKLTPGHRAKISAGLKAAWPKRSRKVTPETRAKISAGLKGRSRKFTPEHRANIKASWLKRKKPKKQ
jgi:hypothetical protein